MERFEKKDPAGSLPHFQRAITEYPGYFEAYDRVGAANLQLWRLPEAEHAYRKSIEVSGGGYAHPLIALGAILDGQKNFTEALTALHSGLDLAPDSWTGHYYLALAQFGLNRLEDAEQSAREALQHKADFPSAQLLLADIHSRQKNYSALVNDLNEYLRRAPDGPSSGWARAVRESALRLISQPESAAAITVSKY